MLVSDNSAVTANRPAVFAELIAFRMLTATAAAVSVVVKATRRFVATCSELLLSNSKVRVLTPSLTTKVWPSLN